MSNNETQMYQGIDILSPVPNVKVSVILVARNESEWLRKCIDSALAAKNRTSFEIVLVDDCSTDGSTYDLAVHKFKRIEGAPIGPSRARNYGAFIADGEILIFCDAHLKYKDYWIDGLIQPILDGRCDVVNPIISDIAVTSTKGHGWAFDLNTYTYKWDIPTNEFRLTGGMAGGCFAIQRDTFFSVGSFDRGFNKWGMEDSELALRLSLSGYRIGVEPSVDVGHFFKEINEYGVDWYSLNYNFLRMAYVNMDNDGFNKVFELIKGDPSRKAKLKSDVIQTSEYRKSFCSLIRKISFEDYISEFGRRM